MSNQAQRLLVCTRCGLTCMALYQNVNPVGLRDVFRAKSWSDAASNVFTLMVQDDIAPHIARCGLPCGDARYDGVGRHTGPDCEACAKDRKDRDER